MWLEGGTAGYRVWGTGIRVGLRVGGVKEIDADNQGPRPCSNGTYGWVAWYAPASRGAPLVRSMLSVHTEEGVISLAKYGRGWAGGCG